MFFAAASNKQRTLKHRNTQNGSKSTKHKSQTVTFWTCGPSKFLFSARSAKMIDSSSGFWTSELICFWKVQQKWIFKFTCCILQNSERRLLKQWAEDTKQELSLANKELTAVSFFIRLLHLYNFQIKDKV